MGDVGDTDTSFGRQSGGQLIVIPSSVFFDSSIVILQELSTSFPFDCEVTVAREDDIEVMVASPVRPHLVFN